MNVKVLFVAGFGPISRDNKEARKLYQSVLSIPFHEGHDGYVYSTEVEGVKHFAVWPLEQAAQSCFGKKSWPGSVPVPQAWIEFDVEDVEKATAELEAQGYKMLVANRKEPWGQTVSRFIGPEGLLVGITFTPSLRK